MAAASSASGERFDGKLDSLLKRQLSQADYEQILTTEVCIYVSNKGKRLHGHVIISHSHLYFVPIPIKDVHTIVRLTDIVTMTLVNDEPDFLAGKSKENTLHLIFNFSSSLANNDDKTPPSINTTPTRSLLATPLAKKKGLNIFHLYLLKTHTAFVTYMNLQLEDVYCMLLLNNECSKTCFVLEKQAYIYHYHSLKADILSAESAEISAQLYLELSTAMKRYFQLKLLFWQDGGELLKKCIKDIQRVHDTPLDELECLRLLTLTSHTLDQYSSLYNHRYHVIVTEVILETFKGTLSSKGRLMTLTQNNGQLIEGLCHQLLNIFTVRSPKLGSIIDNDDKYIKSIDELTINCSGIFYEISRVINHQIRVIPSPGVCNTSSSSSITRWCDNTCAAHRNSVHCLNRLMMALCNGVRNNTISKESVYRLVSLLVTWMSHSPRILDICRSNFKEEVAYDLCIIIPQSPPGNYARGSPAHHSPTHESLLDDKLRRLQTLILN